MPGIKVKNIKAKLMERLKYFTDRTEPEKP
jgi:hypothetical protein